MAVMICTERAIKDNGYAPCASREVTYEGAVLDLIERNGSSDSDFCAIVWDAAEQRVRVVEYGTTRFWTYHNHAKVDATPEVIEAARAWMRGWWERLHTDQAERKAREPEIGRVVRSITTRGKNKGAQGEIKWQGVNGYRSNRWRTYKRFGIDTADRGRVFLDDDQIEVINPEPVDAEEIARIARSKDTQFRAVAYAHLAL